MQGNHTLRAWRWSAVYAGVVALVVSLAGASGAAAQVNQSCGPATHAGAAPAPSTSRDITTKACFLRGSGFGLGRTNMAVTPTPEREGAYQHFEHASIYWSPSTGAHVVFGDILRKWAELDWEHGLGFPTTDELITPDGRGRYNHFEFGSIYWTPETGAHEVHGAILNTWSRYGWERAGGPEDNSWGARPTPKWAMGYPITDEMGTADGLGRSNFFENGAIFWTLDSGAHRVYGRILAKWRRDGAEARMGYPANEPTMNGPNFCGGLSQKFVREDGTGGWYCEQEGFTEYRAFEDYMPSNGLPSVIVTGSGGTKPTTGPVEPAPAMPAMPDTGTWVCVGGRAATPDPAGNFSVPSVPSGLVATQYDPFRCPPQIAGQQQLGAMFVTRPQHDMWVCAWAADALDGFVVDRSEVNASVCGGGVRSHIVKL